MSGRAFETLFDRLHDYSAFIIEFMGTFFLILTIGLVSNAKPSPPVIAPIAIGSTLMVCVFMGGHISGAHYNPAVTFGVWLSGRDKIKLRTAIGYVVAQLIGSLLASFSYWTITDDTMPLYPTSGTSDSKAMFVEILYTTLLVSVVLNTATTKSQADNSFYGLAIGFTVVAGATCTGPISGGVFNPAVGFGPIIVNSLNNGAEKLSHLWIYWIGPPLGAVLAAFIFRITNHHHEYRSSQSELAALPRDPDMSRDSDTLLDNPAAAPATYTI